MKMTITTLTLVFMALTMPTMVLADGTTKDVNCREVYGQGTICDKVHVPENTAIGDSVYALIVGIFGAGVGFYYFSKKLAV